jgi:5-methylthioadenosine/S-adenosylhomocysteine deaminase
MSSSPEPQAPLGVILSSAETVAAVAPDHLPLRVVTSHGETTVYLPPSPSKLAAAQATAVARGLILVVRRLGGLLDAAAVEALRLQGVDTVLGLVRRVGGDDADTATKDELHVKTLGLNWEPVLLDAGGEEAAVATILAQGGDVFKSRSCATIPNNDPAGEHDRAIVDMIISGRWVIPMEPDENVVLHSHAVVVDKGKVAAVLPVTDADSQYIARERIERPRSVIIPGLINAHTHSGMSLMRGMADDQTLMEWLQETVWPVETAFCSVPGFCEDGALLAASEMARGGVTTFSDMYWWPESAARVALRLGMRAMLGMIIIMFPSDYAKDTDEYIDKGHALMDEFKDESRLHFAYAPHAPYTVSDDVFERLRDLSEKSGTLIHTHLHETADECIASATLDRGNSACHQSEHGIRPLANFDRMRLLSPRLLCAHMTQLTGEEIALLAEHRVSIAHCPTSNAKLASGFCPVPELLAAGVNIALGTDSAASNNSQDMFSEMKMAALVAKNVSRDATVVPAAMALRMATRNGAEALGIGGITGSLKPGKAADITVVDMETHAANSPVFDVRSALVYAAARTDVSDVFVEGRYIVKHGSLVAVDEAEVVRKARSWAAKIVEKFPPKDMSMGLDACPPSPAKS